MNKKNRIPGYFKTEEEAGKFWDKHSAGNYPENLKETEIDFDIKKKVYLVPVNERNYKMAEDIARSRHSTAKRIINNFLNRDLVSYNYS